MFNYFWYDLKKASALGERKDAKHYSKEDPVLYEYTGKNKHSDYTNILKYSNNVLGHQDRSKFITKEVVNVYPGVKCHNNKYDCPNNFEECKHCREADRQKRPVDYDFKSNPDASVQNITYRQAKAYYHWRIRELKQNKISTKDNPVYELVMPTATQWKKVIKEETVTLTPEKIQYPTSRFRYVVRIFPSNSN